MKTIKFGNRELNIKYGYKATLRVSLLKKIIQMSDIGADMESVERLLDFLPEMLLAGLQKFHADEFGYDPDNEAQKAEKMDKVYDLLDDYFDSEDGDMQTLFATLQKEMLDNGFLSKVVNRKTKKSKAQPEPEAIEEVGKNEN